MTWAAWTGDDCATLRELSVEIGRDRSSVPAFIARTLRKLLSDEHRVHVVSLLDAAIAKRSGAIRFGHTRAELEALIEIDWLLDALDWLDDARTGAIVQELRDRANEGPSIWESIEMEVVL
jgi:hypothetical protein